MSLILCIETTSKNCSVALVEDSELLGLKETEEEGYTHAENLSLFIDLTLKESNKDYTDLSALAISEGPGSYTGLRIGAATAKGICYALNIPLIAINTLSVLAKVMRSMNAADYYCPLIDARRMEVYTAVFNEELECMVEPRAKILDENSFSTFLKNGKVSFVGSGAFKFSELVSHKNAVFLKTFSLSAKFMIEEANEKFKNKEFEDIAYFEPFYLKPFQATIPKDKLRINQ